MNEFHEQSELMKLFCLVTLVDSVLSVCASFCFLPSFVYRLVSVCECAAGELVNSRFLELFC